MSDKIFIKLERNPNESEVWIAIDDISFIESSNNGTEIFIKNGGYEGYRTSREPTNQLLERLREIAWVEDA